MTNTSRLGLDTTTAPVFKGMIVLYLLSIVVPGSFTLGSWSFGYFRFLQLVMFFPMIGMVLTSRYIKLNLVDLWVVLHVLWYNMSILVNHGPERIEFVGMQIVDAYGGYLFARAFITSVDAFKFFWKCFAAMMLFIFPFAFYEMVYDRNPFSILMGQGGSSGGGEKRYGLRRVSSTFQHPILYGVFWATGIANLLYIFKSFKGKILVAANVLVVFCSLSSGALLFALVQMALWCWDWLTRSKWKLLLVLAVVCYIILELLSNRSAIAALTARFAFSAHNAYWRLVIWEYGSQSVLDNPIFGLGLHDWYRPDWMHSSSVDNHWLLIAMRSGFPGIIFLLLAFLTLVVKMVRSNISDPVIKAMRTGYLIAFVGMFVALGTVAVWNEMAAYLMFYVGMGMWMLNLPAQSEIKVEDMSAEEQAKPTSSYTRFTKRKYRNGQKVNPAKS